MISELDIAGVSISDNPATAEDVVWARVDDVGYLEIGRRHGCDGLFHGIDYCYSFIGGH